MTTYLTLDEAQMKNVSKLKSTAIDYYKNIIMNTSKLRL